jgi:hypothetical protein
MSVKIESLESRTLMTAAAATIVADAAAVKSDIAAAKAELVVLRASEFSFYESVAAEVKLTQTKAQRKINARLGGLVVHTAAVYYGRISGAENSLAANANARDAASVVNVKQFDAHPTKAAYQKAIAKDITLLETVIPAKLASVEALVTAALTAINADYSSVEIEDPQTTDIITADEATAATAATNFTDAAAAIQAGTALVATDLSTPVVSTSTLTGAMFFRGDSTGTNLGTSGSTVDYGAWTSGLDVQNVPGNYGAEFFISKVPNPTSTADFISPGNLAASLAIGVNTFYFWADGDDTRGGADTFGLNLYFNNSTSASPSISGYTVPGTGQTLAADSSSITAGAGFVPVAGAGTLTAGGVTLSSFVVDGVSGQGSTVDVVDSTNTAPFSFPVVPDGITDTYGTFTLTATS